MRSEPSIQLGGAGSGSGSGRYSSSGSNSMTFLRGCSGIPNENSAPCVIGYSNTDGGLAFSWRVRAYGRLCRLCFRLKSGGKTAALHNLLRWVGELTVGVYLIRLGADGCLW